MGIQLKTQEQLLIDMLAQVSEKIDKREGSLIYTSLAPIAHKLAIVYLDLLKTEQNTFLTTATGEYLDRKVAERGLIRKQATKAVRKGKFDINVGTNMEFETIAGSDSVIFTTSEFIENSGGFYYYKMICNTAGTLANGYTGGLTDLNGIEGLTVAQIEDILIPGSDIETDDELRQRYIDSLTSQVFGGNIASYEDFLTKQDGFGICQIYPFWKGGGTVLISFLDSDFNIPTNDFINKLQYLICPPEADNATPSANGYGMAPIGTLTTLQAPTKFEVNISGSIMITVGVQFDMVIEEIKQNIERYLLNVRKTWNKRISDRKIEYNVSIVYAQIYAAIINTNNVVNVRDIKLNEDTIDITMTENAQLQQVPFLENLNITQWND